MNILTCSLCTSSSKIFLYKNHQPHLLGLQRKRFVVQAIKSPKGFGPPPKNSPAVRKAEIVEVNKGESKQREEPDDEEVPEVVTNRMLKRMAFTVGVPTLVGVGFFFLYYYLKVVAKIDIPEWLPIVTSFLTFGTSTFGVAYAVMSSSWDAEREGSLLGWTEAKANWPVLWASKTGVDDSID